MALESPGQVLPPIMDRATITPPPSAPIPDSDGFVWSDWDLEDLQELDNEILLASTSLGLARASEEEPPPPPPPPQQQPPFQSSSTLDDTTELRPSHLESMMRYPPSRVESTEPEPTQPPDDDSGEASLPLPIMTQPSRKRLASSQGLARSLSGTKRTRTSDVESGQVGAGGRETPEAIDLVTDEDVVVSSMVQQQAEQGKKDNEPTKLSHLQCVICLESPTDITVTHCGHLFCHACLMAAIANHEASRNKCPVCRRLVSRVKKNAKGEHVDFQPLELKFTTRIAKEKDAAKG